MIHHLLVFAPVALVAWAAGTFAFIYFQPRIFYTGVRRVVLRGMGIKAGGIPVNTFYALAALNSPAMSKSDLILTGNRDTLYTGGGLDLGPGTAAPARAGHGRPLLQPRILRPLAPTSLPSSAGAPAGLAPATTSSAVRTGKGAVPEGVTKIASPSNSVFVIGRVLVEGDGDVSTAYDLAKQIQVAPLAGPGSPG